LGGEGVKHRAPGVLGVWVNPWELGGRMGGSGKGALSRVVRRMQRETMVPRAGWRARGEWARRGWEAADDVEELRRGAEDRSDRRRAGRLTGPMVFFRTPLSETNKKTKEVRLARKYKKITVSGRAQG